MKIYLDMDGVLSDLVPDLIILHHDKGYVDNILKNWTPGEYDLSKILKVPKDKIFSSTTVEFWTNLRKTPECDSLISLLKNYFDFKDISVLTSPANKESVIGKKEWMKKNLPEIKKVILTHVKEKYADSNNILIDDSDDKINSFKKAGGIGILFPRIWNSNYKILNPLKYIKDEILSILTEKEIKSSIQKLR